MTQSLAMENWAMSTARCRDTGDRDGTPYSKDKKQVMNDICKTGPFSYRDEKLQVDLAASYTFRVNWGGATYSTTRSSKTRATPQDWHPPTPVDSSGFLMTWW